MFSKPEEKKINVFLFSKPGEKKKRKKEEFFCEKIHNFSKILYSSKKF